jgi:hypothetical protein
MPVKLGEVVSKVSTDTSKTEEVTVCLKASYFDRLKTAKFKLSEDLKAGDEVKITIEKV